MQNFTVFVPLEKGIEATSRSKITEFTPEGKTKTRYRLKGVASATSLDRDNERVSKECMRKMAHAIMAKKLPIFGNHEHNWENMLGYSNYAEVKGEKMPIEILTECAETNPKIDMLVGKLDSGMPLGLSIGGKVKDFHEEYEPELKKKIKIIDEVDLLETSIVGIAANTDADLSLAEQILKSLKQSNEFKGEEIFLDEELEKSAGQSGLASYGKLGETTPEARCPNCGRPGELRTFENGVTLYQCHFDGTMFSVESQGRKPETKPDNQPARQPMQKIDQQAQETLGGSSKAVKEDIQDKIEKGERMDTKVSKDAEAEAEAKKKRKEAEAEARCKEADAEAEAEGVHRVKKESEGEEDEYKAWRDHKIKEARFEARYKAEGIDTVPGGEASQPKNTIGGSGGTATPSQQKSMQSFESMKKAIKENMPVEGLETKKETIEGDLSFKSFRQELMNKSGGRF